MSNIEPEVIHLDDEFLLPKDIARCAVLAVCGYDTDRLVVWASKNGHAYLSYRRCGEWHDMRLETYCDMDEFSDEPLYRRYQIERQRLVQAGKLKARYATDFASYSACGSSCVGWWL